MTQDGEQTQGKRDGQASEGTDEREEQERAEQRAAEDETISDSEKCPECGAPVENLRATCPNCGYEYKDDDYDQPDAGKEFETGSELDDSGEEVVDESGKVASEREDES